MAEPSKRRSRDRVFCHHCHEYLPKSTFYRHKEAFFSHVSRQWQQKDDSCVSRAKEVAQNAIGDATSGMCSSDVGDEIMARESQGLEVAGSREHEGRLFQALAALCTSIVFQ